MQFEQEQTLTKGNRMAKNPKVKAATIDSFGTDRLPTEETIAEKKSERPFVKKQRQYSMIPDSLARSDFYMRNWPIPKGKEMFPVEWKMQFVELYYPEARLANGTKSPLFIDMPNTVHDVALCERKLKMMREKGMRYTYIKVGEGEIEATWRLEGLDVEKLKADERALQVSKQTVVVKTL